MRSRKPVLFVDFDGVISFVPDDVSMPAVQRFLTGSLRQLDRLVRMARPRVVVSSTWRVMPDPEPGAPPLVAVDVLNGWLRAGGSGVVVEDVTPVHEVCETAEDVERVRGGEIAHWLRANAAPDVPWVALDDMALRGVDGLVRVLGGGLSADDVDRALDVLRPLTDADVRFMRELGAGWVPLRHLSRWRDLVAVRDRLVDRGLVEASGRGRNRALRVTAGGLALVR